MLPHGPTGQRGFLETDWSGLGGLAAGSHKRVRLHVPLMSLHILGGEWVSGY
jgi:hypothetical protein